MFARVARVLRPCEPAPNASHDAVDGLRRVAGMQCGKHQVAGFGCGEGGGHGGRVAQLADENHVRGPQRKQLRTAAA